MTYTDDVGVDIKWINRESSFRKELEKEANSLRDNPVFKDYVSEIDYGINKGIFEYVGRKCLIDRGFAGVWRGCVDIQREYKKNKDINLEDFNVEVYGGLDSLNYGYYPGLKGTDLYMVGFGCGNLELNDAIPFKYELLCSEKKTYIYRDVYFIINETKKLAEQLNKLWEEKND